MQNEFSDIMMMTKNTVKLEVTVITQKRNKSKRMIKKCFNKDIRIKSLKQYQLLEMLLRIAQLLCI